MSNQNPSASDEQDPEGETINLVQIDPHHTKGVTGPSTDPNKKGPQSGNTVAF